MATKSTGHGQTTPRGSSHISQVKNPAQKNAQSDGRRRRMAINHARLD